MCVCVFVWVLCVRGGMQWEFQMEIFPATVESAIADHRSLIIMSRTF